jgi:hypothetical protein
MPLAVIVMALMLVGFALYFKLACRSFDRLRNALLKRGYNSPAVLRGSAAAAFIFPFLILLAYMRFSGNNDAAFLWWLVLTPAAPQAFSFAAGFLPARNPRTAGRRVIRFPYRPAGFVLLGCAVLAWTVPASLAMKVVWQIPVGLVATAFGCLAIARRAAAPDATALLAADPRPPVLYLRPFQQEEESFARLPWRWSDLWTSVRQRITRQRKSWLTLTLEQYLGSELSARLGPFIALGNPVDFVPPEGAARSYVADDEWTEHFDDLVRRARCVVIMAAASESVLWELARIRTLGLERKLLVLTQPGLGRKAAAKAWIPFADALRRAGHKPCREDPGPGAAIAFDAAGGAIVIKCDAQSATETVDALCRHVGPLRP